MRIKKRLKPNSLMVRKNRIKPLSVDDKANPAASSGTIKIKEKRTLQSRAFIEIFAAVNC